MLEQQQQQQQQQQPEPGLASAWIKLAVSQLQLVNSLAVLWPAGSSSSSSTTTSSSKSWLSSSKQLPIVALPAVRLAVAVLASSSDQWEINRALTTAMQLCTAIYAEASSSLGPAMVTDGAPAAAVRHVLVDRSSLTPLVLQLLSSIDMLRLLAAAHALCLQQLAWQLRTSISHGTNAIAGDSQSQAAAAAATWVGGSAGSSATAQLLQAAGFPQLQQLLASPAALAAAMDGPFSNGHGIRWVSGVLQVVWGSIARMPVSTQDSSGSSSSSSSNSSSSSSAASSGMPGCKGSCNSAQQQQQQQQQQQMQYLLGGLLQPWALVTVQSVLLAGWPATQQLSSLYALIHLLGVLSKEEDVHAAASIRQSLLQPVLLQLLPHLQQVMADPASRTSEAGSVGSWLEEGLAKLLLLLTDGDDAFFTALLSMICSSSSSSSSPGMLLCAFEAALRHGRGPKESEERSSRCEAAIPAGGIASAMAQTPSRLQQLVRSCRQQPGGGQQLLDQLFALEVTCLKHAWCLLSVFGTFESLQILADCVRGVCCMVIDALIDPFQPALDGRGSSSSSSNSTASSASSSLAAAGSQEQQPGTTTEAHQAEPQASAASASAAAASASAAAGSAAAAQWVALLSRCLFVAASALKAACGAQALASAASEGATVQGTTCSWLNAVKWCKDSVHALAHYMNVKGMPADMLLQLREQAAAAAALLGEMLDKSAAAAGSSTALQLLADMQEAGLPQQLRAFAQAVAGRIPLSSACNNPGCVSLAQRSELLLVGGKSCVCGRCRAARYCCKACQVEHWKWHKALCRSKAKPTAAAAAAVAAAAADGTAAAT
uniref:MYND-type domain-containing protein n=1 Tax=Tetradesmus obliquus TaxID=3088 RepID=A0A383VCK4_TETOB|eukprot:jgi/Sobl393_1/15907/SZX62096.1